MTVEVPHRSIVKILQ